MSTPAVSIGIITLENRTAGLAKLLQHLQPVIARHQAPLEIVIVNNSGEQAAPVIDAAIDSTGIRQDCSVRLVVSQENNIAVGRNLLLDESCHDLLVFLDDDEYPEQDWLQQLLIVHEKTGASSVSGPVFARFSPAVPRWVHTVDLHNTEGKINEEVIEHTGTCNVLIDKTRIGHLRFDRRFGKTGGSDTDFFIRLREQGGSIYWASKAIVHEDILSSRTTTRYLIRRFIKQGENYRRISLERGISRSPLLLSTKAVAVVVISFPIALVLVLIRHPRAGHWMKRAFSNYGKLHSPSKALYDS